MSSKTGRRWLATLATLILIPSSTSLGQNAPPPSNMEKLFSTWVKLSLVGYTQSEIESTLIHADPKVLDHVKHRLRLNVVNNLRRMNLENEIHASSTEQDLAFIIDKVRTEIRFAGLENDRYVLVMIRNQFGLAINSI